MTTPVLECEGTGLVVLLFALAATIAAMVMGSVLRNASEAGAMGNIEG